MIIQYMYIGLQVKYPLLLLLLLLLLLDFNKN